MDRNHLMQRCLPMKRGSLLRIEDGRDTVVTVLQGELWLTQEGDRRDRYLAAGQSFRLDRPGVAVAHAMQRAFVTIAAPDRQLYKRSFGARLVRFWSSL